MKPTDHFQGLEGSEFDDETDEKIVALNGSRKLLVRNGRTFDHRPELIIDPGDLPEAARQLGYLLADKEKYFFNGSALIFICEDEHSMPRATKSTAEKVIADAHGICRPKKKTKDGLVDVTLSKDLALIYLNGLEGEWGLKTFRGITTTPILLDDGEIVHCRSGFHADTGLWCHKVPEVYVADRPTEEEAREALYCLRMVFRTFCFADRETVHDPELGVDVTDLDKPMGMDESTFLVALLTAIARPSLNLAPGFLCNAPNVTGAGSGKGLLVKAICIIASGAAPSAFTGGHDGEELEKRITSVLTRAQPAIFLDNFNAQQLKSDTLASAITENPCMTRVFGQTKMVPLHVSTFIGITGNGIQIAEDMARRLLVCNLDARMDDPESRPFAPGFLDKIHDSRDHILHKALTIWRWGRQANLKLGKPLGSFEHWAQWCRDPIVALGGRDPVERIAEIKANDPVRQQLAAIFETWDICHGDEAMKAEELKPEVKALIDDKPGRDSEGNPLYSRQKVSRWCAKHVGSRVGGCVLEKIPGDPSYARPVARYRLKGKT
jgi:hypothetical protein